MIKLREFVEIVESIWQDIGNGGHRHYGSVDSHDVQVTAATPFHAPHSKTFHVNFGVKSPAHDHWEVTKSQGAASRDTGRRIMHHVSRAVHDFVRQHKPVSLKFAATDDSVHHEQQKHRVYAAFAHHLARKHGGVVRDHGRSNGVEVSFPHISRP